MLFGSRLNRLATSIRRGISKYSVGSDNPGLVFDFIDNFYQKDKNQTVNFDGAITHARSGNAVMTDGYGPELVTNGSFANGLTGWSDNSTGTASPSTSTGAAVLERIDSSNIGIITQAITTVVGVRYIISGNVSGGSMYVWVGTSSLGSQILNQNSNTSFEFNFVATGTTTYITHYATGNGTAPSIDNVSVREMPVLKWGPHNLLSYSEDFSTSWVTTNSTPTASQSDPFGGTSATKITADTIGSFVEVRNNITGYANTKTTVSAIFKAIGVSSLTLRLRDVASVSNRMDYALNISSGTGTASVHGTYSGASGEITDLGDGWYKANLTATTGSNTSQRFDIYISSANVVSTGDFLIADTHAFRSDLGGMAGNPDQPPSRASYVPTTSSAVYLPRVGHHVYNGSAWANEGLLAESESRVNLVTESSFDGWSQIQLAKTIDSAVSPSGQEDAVYVQDNVFNGSHYIYEQTDNPNGTWTFSVYIKEADSGMYAQLRPFGLGSGVAYATFDPADGSVYESGGTNLDQTTSEDVGNGWYRVSITCSEPLVSGDGPMVALTDGTAGELPSYVGASEGVYLYGAQLEEASTPSSLIPTSGSTVSRAAETFTIPSANLPWPSPNYIGSELVDNGDFATTSDWAISSADAASEISGGQAYIESGGGNATLSQTIPTVSGNVYELTFNLVAESSGNNYQGLAYVQQNTSNLAPVNSLDAGVHSLVFVAVADDISLKFMTYGNDGQSFTLDDVSVREIDPLSVSIAMDGRMTYADTSNSKEVEIYQWLESGTEFVEAFLSTSSSRAGEFRFRQRLGSGQDASVSAPSLLQPDILVPFNACGRHGSTFVNGAVDGVALTVNTDPTALADLSATDLELAKTYMGTVGTFRVWDKDLGDTGIVEATNPSLEPSLSLTFEGTGTNSFVVNNWSE